MYPVDFQQRLIKAERTTMGSVNCISAVFWLLGLQKREQEIYPDRKNDEILKTFKLIERGKNLPSSIPDEAVVFGVWGGVDYWHLGVISPFNRDFIIDRPDPSQPIRITTCNNIYQEYHQKSPQPFFDFLKVRPELYLK